MRNGNDLKCSVNWLTEYVGCAKLTLWNGIAALQFADTRREPKTAKANWWKLPTGSLPITAWKVFEYGNAAGAGEALAPPRGD
jgi:hypothetical protein